MSYQALLFCPDERTARTVTQVLSELEFSVELCNEAFAAVKKLMAGHFDAIVVDCDNEQNATLLFKSARGSTSNQSSLAVAVVEGQAGVAKAFRIGANLVLTKPINVEQAKGTLRVARGLLRKGDPAKPAAAPAAPAPVAAAPAPAAPTAPAKPAPRLGVPAVPRPAAPAAVAKPAAPQVSRPIPAAAAKAVTPAPVAKIPDPIQADVLDVDSEESAAPAITKPVAPVAPPRTLGVSTGVNPSMMSQSSGVSPTAGAGAAAAAAAPARAPQVPEFEHPAPAHETISSTPADIEHMVSSSSVSSISGSTPGHAPSFSFGGAPAESDGGNKKIFIGIAAVLVVGAASYFGWTQFHGKTSSPAPVAQQSTPAPVATPQSVVPSKPQPVTSTPAPQSQAVSNPPVSKPEHQVAEDNTADIPEPVAAPTKSSAKKTSVSTAPTKSTPAAAQPEEPRVVKNGASTPAQPKPAPVADAPAPSVLGMTPAPGGGLPNLMANNSANAKPVLQTLNVSQGVSQGLLIKKVPPTYPSTALRMRVEGSVLLNATIAQSGNIASIKVISGEPLLAQAAVDAVKQWKYKPYYLNGSPVEIQTQVTVIFKLPH